MNSKKTIIYTAAAFGLLAQILPAQAADLGNYAGNATMDWSGLYFGALAGYGRSQAKDLSTGNRLKTNGVFDMGLLTGYNFQSGNMVYGLEADITPLMLMKEKKGNSGGITRHAFMPFATIRARVGFATGPMLFYATAGYAVGSGMLKTTGKKKEKLHGGWTAGGGVEFALNRNWALRTEYLYEAFGKASYKLGPARKARYEHAHVFRLGITYRF